MSEISILDVSFMENCPFNKTSHKNCGWLKDDCCSYTKKCILDKGEKCPLVKVPKSKIYADAPNGYMPDGSKLIDVPELYLTSEDYDRIKRETVDAVLDTKEDGGDGEAHQMSVMAVPKPTAYRLTKEDKKKTSSSDKLSDEISNILEQIGDVQAELICRHQFGNSVRPALESTSEEDLCERGFRLFYMLRNKYQGKDAILRETKT